MTEMRSTGLYPLASLLLVVLGCSDPTAPRGLYEEGIITSLNFQDPLRTMLVDSDPGTDPDPLCETAAYYTLGNDTRIYRLGGGSLTQQDLAVGKRVSVEYDGSQLDSCPPIRAAQNVFVH